MKLGHKNLFLQLRAQMLAENLGTWRLAKKLEGTLRGSKFCFTDKLVQHTKKSADELFNSINIYFHFTQASAFF